MRRRLLPALSHEHQHQHLALHGQQVVPQLLVSPVVVLALAAHMLLDQHLLAAVLWAGRKATRSNQRG